MADKNVPHKVSVSAFEDENFRSRAKVNPIPFYLPVNPESFSQSYSVELSPRPKDNNNRKTGLEVVPPEELKLNFIFDGTNAIEGYRYNGKDHTVQGQLEFFLDTVFNRKEKIQKPYFLKVAWGKFIFPCVLRKLDLDYTMFEPNGNPLRIYVRTVFISLRSIQNITEGDSLSSDASSNIKNVNIPGRQPGKNFPFKPPLLNLPVIYPPVRNIKRLDEKFTANEQPEAKNNLSCPNAGIILLHPFLKKCFEKLELLEGAEFRNAGCQQQAVLLIHYLATGRETFLEKEPFIPNLLCGLPPELKPAEDVVLNSYTKEEAVILLQSAIKHWGVLGSTSIDTFRETFLIRGGNLEQGENRQKIHLLPTAFDVLLDKLPWNLSIIKLPWMETYLSVIWR